MTLLGLIVVLLIVGVVMAMVPVDAVIKKLIYGVIAVVLILAICSVFGVFGDSFGPYIRIR